MSKTVSVIIPCYNYSKYIPDALESVKKSILEPDIYVKIIVVDDGSTDDLHNIIKCQYPDVQIIKQSHKGVSVARNTGIANSTSDYVLFLDADDIITETTIQYQINNIEQNSNCDISVCQGINLFKNDDNNQHALRVRPLFRDSFERHLCHANIAPIHSFLFKRKCFKKLMFNKDLNLLEDYELLIKCIITKFRLVANPTTSVIYRIHNDSSIRANKNNAQSSLYVHSLIKNNNILNNNIKLQIPLAAGFAKIASQDQKTDNCLSSITKLLHNYYILRKEIGDDDIVSLYYAISIYKYLKGNNKAKIITDLLQKMFVDINFEDNIEIIHRQIFNNITYSQVELANALVRADDFLSRFFMH